MTLTDAKSEQLNRMKNLIHLPTAATCFCQFTAHATGGSVRYRILGKEKTSALGVYPAVSLSEAREKRDVARKQITEGTDPCEQKRIKKSVPEAAQKSEGIAK